MLTSKLKHRFDQLELIAALLVLLAALGYVLWCIPLLWQLRISGLWLDLWDALVFVKPALEGHWDITSLLSPYGGAHRIALPRLLFFLDARYFNLSNQLLFNTAILMHSTLALFFMVLITKVNTISVVGKVLLSSIVALCFFSTTQWFNLLYPSDIQLFGATFFSVMAIALSMHFSQVRHRYIFMALLLFLVLVAGFFQFLGLLAGFIIALSFFWQKKPKAAGVFLLLTLLVLFIYLPSAEVRGGWTFSWSGLPFLLPHVLWYVVRYLSSPLSREFLFPAVLLALGSILVVLTCSYYAIRGAYQDNKALRFFLLLAWFVIVVAAVTSVGRIWQPNSATTERYQTLSLLYWVAFPVLLCFLRRDVSIYKRLIPWVSLCLVCVVLAPAQKDSFQSLILRLDKNQQSQMAYKSGFMHTPEVNGMLSHPHLVSGDNPAAVYFDWLKQQHLGAFATNRIESNHAKQSASHCEGAIVKAEKISGGYKVSGYVKTLLSRGDIVIVLGDVQGYGALHYPPKYPYLLANTIESSPWQAYLKTNVPQLDNHKLKVFFGTENSWCKVSI